MVETPLTAGDLLYYLSFRLQRALTAETFLTAGSLRYYHSSDRWTQQQKFLVQLGRSIIIQQSNKKGFNRQQPFYRWTCSSLQQQRASATNYPSLAALLPSSSTSEGLISQANILLSNSPIRKGVIDNNPFYRRTCSSLQQQRASAIDYPSLIALLPSSSTLEGFISKLSYSWADLSLSSNSIRKGLIDSNPFYHWTYSSL